MNLATRIVGSLSLPLISFFHGFSLEVQCSFCLSSCVLTIWTLGFKVCAQASSGRIGPKAHFVRVLSSVVHLFLKPKVVAITFVVSIKSFHDSLTLKGKKRTLQKVSSTISSYFLSLICNLKIIPIFKILPLAHVK